MYGKPDESNRDCGWPMAILVSPSPLFVDSQVRSIHGAVPRRLYSVLHVISLKIKVKNQIIKDSHLSTSSSLWYCTIVFVHSMCVCFVARIGRIRMLFGFLLASLASTCMEVMRRVIFLFELINTFLLVDTFQIMGQLLKRNSLPNDPRVRPLVHLVSGCHLPRFPPSSCPSSSRLL